ncbi:MAG: DUF7594 domain-containing protein, partial [Tepidisphaeraceae bacterium]
MSRTHKSSCVEVLERRVLLAAGALDKSFSGDGKAAISLAGTTLIATLIANDVAVQPDGKTVIVGPMIRDASPHEPFFAVARLNLDGTPDTTFGGGGIASPSGIRLTTFRGDRTHEAQAVAIQPDGKILVAGELGDEWAVVRYLPNGTLDLSFDGDGVQTIEFNREVNDIALQSDGKIVVVGNHLDGILLVNINMAIARLNPNGSFDDSFDGDGKKQIQFGDDELAEAVAIDGAGRIIVAGGSGLDTERMVLTRLSGKDGSVDLSFGSLGLASVSFPRSPRSQANEVLIQSSGKIVVVGRAETPAGVGEFHFLIGRFLSTGKLDTTFGAAHTGLTSFAFGASGASDEAFGVIQSVNGGLVVAGEVNGKFALLGLTNDGLFDSNFGPFGKIVTDFGSVDTTIGFRGGNIAKGPGRRWVVAGGLGFKSARYLDTGANVVSVGSFDPNSTEGSPDSASLIVGRTERLPIPTRVFFSIGGTATQPGFFVNRQGVVTLTGDYTLAGMSNSPFAGGTFVDIPANETFVTVTLTPRNDSTVEGLETATFSILPDATYEIGTNPGTKINIVDDDGAFLNATADAYVRDGTSSGTNFGSAPELQVKKAGSGLNRNGYLKFDTFGVNAINSAKLRVFGRLSDTQNTNLATSLFSVANTSWTEGGITFNNQPAAGATALATATIIDNTARFYEFDVTAYAKAEKAAGRNIVSFVLKNPATSAAFLTFNSREAVTNGAQLIISGISGANVGTSVLTPGAVDLPKNGKVTYKLEWTHPGVWRDLDTIELRIVNDAGVLAWIKWDETTNALSLGDPKTGQFSRSG